MKVVTKDRLLMINKVLKILLVTFAWIMACIGVTAYSVYWIRQNDSLITEKSKIHNPKNSPLYKSGDYDYAYYTKPQSLYETELYYESNTLGYKTYFDIDYDNWPQEDTVPYIVVYFTGDFYCRIDGSTIVYDRLFMTFNYSSSTRSFQPRYFYLARADATGSRVIYSNGEIGSQTYLPCTILFKNVRGNVTNHIVNKITNGVIKFYFDEVFNYSNSTPFNFNDMYNYVQLFSYQTFSNGVFKYNGTTSVTPLDIWYTCDLTFESNGQLFEGIRFYCSAVGYVADNNGSITEYDNRLASSTTDFYLALTEIQYINYHSNTSLVVASLGVLEYKTTYKGQNVSAMPVYLTQNGYNWIDANYKYLNISNSTLDNNTSVSLNYINSSVCPFLNLNSYKALTFETSDIITGSTVTDIGLSNVFTLMSKAFSGLAGLLAIQILPGLTLGLLCFVPLIVTIIIVVLRLVKK